MIKHALISFSLIIFMQVSYCYGDVFDKAESSKDCLQNNKCEGHKWLGRIAAINKCKNEGNCLAKVNETVANNQDKIQGELSKVTTLNNCMNATDSEELKKCYEIIKAHHRAKQAKKEEAARALQSLASEQKTQGDAVCLPGTLAFGLVKAKIKGFVEQVSGDRIQITIADTQGQEIRYQGQALQQGTTLWDAHSNWVQCQYLK